MALNGQRRLAEGPLCARSGRSVDAGFWSKACITRQVVIQAKVSNGYNIRRQMRPAGRRKPMRRRDFIACSAFQKAIFEDSARTNFRSRHLHDARAASKPFAF